MYPTTFLTKTISDNTLSPNVYLSDFHILESIQRTQDTTTYPDNYTSVAWATTSHKKLTMEPTTDALTIKCCDSCKRTGQLADSCWK